MKSAKRSILGIGLMFTAVILSSISMSAQQEVSPDHFDDNPVVSKKAKSAPKPAKQVAVKKPTAASRVANKPKETSTRHESAQLSPVPVQTASNR